MASKESLSKTDDKLSNSQLRTKSQTDHAQAKGPSVHSLKENQLEAKASRDKTPSSSQLKNKPRSNLSQAKVSSVHSLKSDNKLETKVSRVRVQERSGEDEEQKKTEIGARRASKTLSSSNLQRNRSGSRRESDGQGSSELLRRRSDRPSKSVLGLGSIISIKRGSMAADYIGGYKALRYLNTYKLDSDKPFNVEKVEKILKDVMIEALENLTYDPEKCPKQAKWATTAIKAKVKEQEFDRYKLVCVVTIGEKMSQDVHMTCRFLWDADRDKYATFVHENMYVFGVAMCFGLYYE